MALPFLSTSLSNIYWGGGGSPAVVVFIPNDFICKSWVGLTEAIDLACSHTNWKSSITHTAGAGRCCINTGIKVLGPAMEHGITAPVYLNLSFDLSRILSVSQYSDW